MPARFRPATLVAGLALIALGAWIVLDDAGVLDVSFRALAPALLGAAGLVLVVNGLARRGGRRSSPE